MAVKSYTKGQATQLTSNFKSTDFDCKCRESNCTTTLIDDNLVAGLEKLVQYVGPITINSGYRCEKHNADVSKTKNSYHVQGMAADLLTSKTTPANIAKYAEALGFKGIGLYESNDGNFVHVDTRASKSFWYGQAEAYKDTFGGAGLIKINNFNTTEATIWNYLTKTIGLTPAGAAGLMGNLYHESNLVSNNLQNEFQEQLGYNDATYTAAIDNGSYSRNSFIYDKAGYGLAQWTFWSRKQALYDYINPTVSKVSISNLDKQLEHLKYELENMTEFKSVYELLKITNSVNDASDKVLKKFENPEVQTSAVINQRRKKSLEYFTRAQSVPTYTIPTKPNITVLGYTNATHSRKNTKIEYIVVHYTAGITSKSGAAKDQAIEFKNRTVDRASADFIIDDANIIQYQADINSTCTWHSGDGSYGGKVEFENCIGIEICSTSKDGVYHKDANNPNWYYTDAVLDNAVKLIKWLMYEYNIPISNVIRHFDVSGKYCPGIIGWNTGDGNTEEKWLSFKNRLSTEISSNYVVTYTGFPYTARVTTATQTHNGTSTENEVVTVFYANDIVIISEEKNDWALTQTGWIPKQFIQKIPVSQSIVEYIYGIYGALRYDETTGELIYPFENTSNSGNSNYLIYDPTLKSIFDLRETEIKQKASAQAITNEEFIKNIEIEIKNNKTDKDAYKQRLQLALKTAIKNRKSLIGFSSPSNLVIRTASDALTDVSEEFILEKLDSEEGRKDIVEYFQKTYNDDGWNKNVEQAPETLNFWFDFMNVDGELGQYSVKIIGSRPKAINNDKISAIYFQETPSVLFLTPEEYRKLVSNKEDYNDMTGYTFIQLQPFMESYFTISGQGKSAQDELDNLLYQHAYVPTTTTLTTVPIFHLQPNTRVFVKDDNTGINGEYIVSKITIPLQYNGTTSITTNKAVERIY